VGAKNFIRVPEKVRFNFTLLASALILFMPLLIKAVFSLIIK